MGHELPQTITPITRERADARRNRERILCEAARLFAARGVANVSMDDVAAAAGVGKGTLYRRFQDRGQLLRALVEEPERDLQDRMIRGEPPLGPGAPVRDRVHAFGTEYLAFLDAHGDFILGSETDMRRYTGGPYRFYRMHLGVLLREALGEGARVDYLADALMACLNPMIVLHQLRERGLTLDEVRAGWCTLADSVLASAPASAGGATGR
jgi:AcrR family transcriptional regulator